MKPIIGITPAAARIGPAGRLSGCCEVAYSRAIERAGGVPLVLPLTQDRKTLERFLAICDGFLLSGGGDLCETTGAYGRRLTNEERRTLSGVEPLRDEMELFLARRLVERNVPLLGICRGAQVMNVALGGTLLPDVAGHRTGTHGIKWSVPLFRLRRVNSSHHQALDQVAAALTVAARSEDGLVEAVIVAAARFCVGVQFHPERMRGGDESFRKLVAAARGR